MRTSLPVWTIPLLLALVGITAVAGNLGTVAMIFVSIETLGFCAYLIYRSRCAVDASRPVSNLIALFPGHLLLLLAISSLPSPDGLAALWAVVPPATVLYDVLAWKKPLRAPVRASISAVLYAILWGVVFFLLERLVALTRDWDERILIAVFGLVGGVFLGLGLYRHRLAAKE